MDFMDSVEALGLEACFICGKWGELGSNTAPGILKSLHIPKPNRKLLPAAFHAFQLNIRNHHTKKGVRSIYDNIELAPKFS